MRNHSTDSAQIFLKVFENTHIPMVISSFETGIIHYVNKIFLDMFGFESGEVAGRTIKELDIYVDYGERIKAMDIFRREGKVVERDASGAPLKAIGTHIDVTSQKDTEEKLKELINTRNKLFSVISHDLRGPVGNILPVLDLICEEGESLDRETQNALLGGLKESAGNAYKLLENLLMWSRSQTGVIKIEKENIDIGKLISENIRLAESQASAKGISVSANIGRNIFAYADMNSADLVIRNLISNSVKFTKPGGNIFVEAKKSDGVITVSVKDSGIGMSSEILAGLFTINPLHHASGTANEPGSGLGLVLCREFVEKNGGTIKVESEEGKGSTFTFTLPAV